jgi:hypothetical protein
MKKKLARTLPILLLAAAAMTFAANAARAQSGEIDEAVTANGVDQKLELTAAQKNAMYQQVHKDQSKVAPSRFTAHVGADVPPMIELYPLPDDVVADNPGFKLFKFIRVDDQVVLVDPTQMRVVAVIGPKPGK